MSKRHAILIGVHEPKGQKRLPGIPQDIARLAAQLMRHNFTILGATLDIPLAGNVLVRHMEKELRKDIAGQAAEGISAERHEILRAPDPQRTDSTGILNYFKPPATAANLESQLEVAWEQPILGECLLIYLSGHCARTRDARTKEDVVHFIFGSGEMKPLKDIVKEVHRAAAVNQPPFYQHTLMVVVTCFSGAALDGIDPDALLPSKTDYAGQRWFAEWSFELLASSTPDKRTFGDNGNTPFTSALIKVLAGHASQSDDPDRRRGGTFTIADQVGFLKKAGPKTSANYARIHWDKSPNSFFTFRFPWHDGELERLLLECEKGQVLEKDFQSLEELRNAIYDPYWHPSPGTLDLIRRVAGAASHARGEAGRAPGPIAFDILYSINRRFWVGTEELKPYNAKAKALYERLKQDVDLVHRASVLAKPVTRSQFQEFDLRYLFDAQLSDGGEKSSNLFGNRPVGGVTFRAAAAFCRWLKGRLPTQQELLVLKRTNAEKRDSPSRLVDAQHTHYAEWIEEPGRLGTSSRPWSQSPKATVGGSAFDVAWEIDARRGSAFVTFRVVWDSPPLYD